MASAIPLFGGIPAGPELLIILLVLVLLFGANKIPKLARSTGQAMGEFKKGREQVEDELQEMQGGSGEESTETAEPTDTVETTGTTESTETVDSDVEEDEEFEAETEKNQ